jgi:hypothetical protein
MPARHLRRAERHRVAHEPERRARWVDELLLRLVLLQNVVLQRAAEPSTFDTVRFGVRDEHREDHRRGTVDRHRRGHRTEINPPIEILDVGKRVDRNAALSYFAQCELVVGVATHQGREVERGRKSITPCAENLVEATVRIDRGAETREHAHRPELGSVHRGERTARVRVLPRSFRIVGSVDGLDGKSRHALEVGHQLKA